MRRVFSSVLRPRKPKGWKRGFKFGTDARHSSDVREFDKNKEKLASELKDSVVQDRLRPAPSLGSQFLSFLGSAALDSLA